VGGIERQERPPTADDAPASAGIEDQRLEDPLPDPAAV
jgi:hypothetical protein